MLIPRKKEINEKTNYGYAERRIESVNIVEVIIVETMQCSENGVGFNGKVWEIWDKLGNYLGSITNP